jgi:transposase
LKKKNVIITKLRNGVSIRAIGREINVDKNTVLLAKRKFEQTGPSKESKAPEERRYYSVMMMRY